MKWLILIFLMAFGNPLLAQKNTNERKNEVGINLYSYVTNTDTRYVDIDGDNPWNSHFINGLVYKRHFKHFIISIGGDYLAVNEPKNDLNNLEDADLVDYIGKYERITARIGIEKRFFSGPVKPYAGLQLNYSYGNSSGSSCGGLYKKCQSYESDIAVVGGGPVFGLYFRFHEAFSMNLESTIQINDTQYYENGINRFSHISTTIDPVRSVAINYHF